MLKQCNNVVYRFRRKILLLSIKFLIISMKVATEMNILEKIAFEL